MKRKILFPFVFLLIATVTTGCLAVAAGAIAGHEAAESENEEFDKIEYYIHVEEPPTKIADALTDKKVIAGMNEKEVRLVMDASDGYNEQPNNIKKTGNEEKPTLWVYEYEDGGNFLVYFRNERVVELKVQKV